MPNWCSNHIRINGDERTISIITDACKRCEGKDMGIFKELIGFPDYMDEEQYEKEWYNTNYEWFGTKKDVTYDECSFDFDDTEINIYVSTAWDPPLNFLSNLVKMYKVDGYIFYSEGGNDFTGEGNITLDENGDLLSDIKDYAYLEGIYHLDKECFWSEVDCHIDNFRDEYEEHTDDNILSYIDETFEFVTEEDKETIINQFKEELNEN